MRLLSTLLFTTLSVNCAYAQEDTSSIKKLNEVILTGQYKPQTLKNSVYQVRVISNQQILRQAPANLQDVLNKQLNIRFSQDLATGGSDITMMGLSGQNVKILIDGVPMIGRQGTSNEININQFNVNTIERIEIVEGPMSVIYGADALAGVINIITKKSSAKKLSVTAKVQEETVGKEYGIKQGIHNQYAGASYNYKSWFVSCGIGRNLFQGWKNDSTGRELTWHKKDQIVGNAVLGYRAGKLNAYYRFDGLDEIITNPANPTATQPALDQDYISDRAMHQLQGTYNFSNKLTANALASYTHFTRQVYSTLYHSDGDVRVSTAPGTQSATTFNGATFRGTVVYSPSDIISFQPGIDINIETAEGERIKTGTQKIEDYAFFLTSEIKPTKRINIRPGVRFINNSVYDAPPVIPSINTKFNLAKDLDLRVAYARGFRSPSLRELYYDFFDASHSIQGNPDLKAEHSNSFTGSLTYQKTLPKDYTLTTTLNSFFNDVDNLIGFASQANNPAVTTYLNISKYKTVGGSINAELHHKRLSASLGYAYTGRYNEYTEDDKSLPEYKFSSEINATASYSFTRIGLDASVFYKYTGKLPYYESATVNNLPVIRLAETAGYHLADITLNKKLFKLLTLNAGVRNLFDVTVINNTSAGGGAHATTGARPIGYGRSYFAGLVFNWSK